MEIKTIGTGNIYVADRSACTLINDHILVDCQGIHPGLHQKELGRKHLLKDFASDVPVRSHSPM